MLCLICALSDALLIAAGVAGLGTLVASSPRLIAWVTVGGALFLFGLRRCWRSDARSTRWPCMAARNGRGQPRPAIAACLAFTFLNPHVYLDTVVLLGGLSAAFEGAERVAYGIGAATASFVWFFGLGYGARLLQPLFARPAAWRVLDVLIALVMAAIGIAGSLSPPCWHDWASCASSACRSARQGSRPGRSHDTAWQVEILRAGSFRLLLVCCMVSSPKVSACR